MRTLRTVCALSLFALAGVGVRRAPASGASPPPPASAPRAPTLEESGSATYDGIGEAGHPVTLSGGRWKGAPFVKGSAAAPSVMLVGNFRLTGDLDGDGAAEAVVLLAWSGGGSGEFLHLAVLGRRNGRVRNIATAPIGDRVQVRDARIDGHRITIDVVQAGPGDAMCCPGELATRSWTLASGRLGETPPRITGRL